VNITTARCHDVRCDLMYAFGGVNFCCMCSIVRWINGPLCSLISSLTRCACRQDLVPEDALRTEISEYKMRHILGERGTRVVL